MNILDMMVLKAQLGIKHLKDRFCEEVGAMGTVEIVVLIGVAVVIAILFRKQIKELLDKLFETIGTNADKAIEETP